MAAISENGPAPETGRRPPLPAFVSPGAAAAALLLSAACFAMLVFRTTIADRPYYFFMMWNLFLAWLPYAGAVAAGAVYNRFADGGALRALVLLALGAFWLLFLPNCAYIVTDVIHLIASRNRYLVSGGFGYLVWFDIALFFLFAWLGILLGYLSTLQFHRMTARRFGPAAGWAFALAASLLAGYGVFLGRIVRLNSWDAWIRPEELLIEAMDNLHFRGIAFSLTFAFLIAATYVTLYLLHERGR